MHQSANQFSFAHHRIEVNAVTGHPHSGAQAKAGGDHAAIAVLVDGDDVGRLGTLARCSQASISAAECASVVGSPSTTGATRAMVPSRSSRSLPRANGEIVHPNRSRGRLDHVVGVQVFLAQSPAVGDGDDQCIGVRTVIERARISQHELVRSVMIRMAQRVPACR